jgi:hypothetical protein
MSGHSGLASCLFPDDKEQIAKQNELTTNLLIHQASEHAEKETITTMSMQSKTKPQQAIISLSKLTSKPSCLSPHAQLETTK